MPEPAIHSMMPLQCQRKDATNVMGGGLLERMREVSLILAFASGCASKPAPSPRDLADANDTGQFTTASSAEERAILAKLPTLPAGSGERVGAAVVLAEPPYTSASGRKCRAIHLERAGTSTVHRLACQNAEGWAFVPDVFGFASAAGSE